MKVLQIITLLAIMLLAVGVSHASFAGHNSENFHIVHTSLQDCEEETTTISFNTPIKECPECESRVRSQEPQNIKPSTSVRQVTVEEQTRVYEHREAETLDVNVLFGSTEFCDEYCEEKMYAPEYSNPHHVEERKTVINRIINFIFRCNECN